MNQSEFLNLLIFVSDSKKDEENAKKLWVETLKKVEVLYDRCEAEVKDLTLCGECYIRSQQEDAFEAVCTQPHLVLWIKYSTYPYWPAKLLKIHTSRNDCFLYSKEDPNFYLTDQYKASIRAAAEVSG